MFFGDSGRKLTKLDVVLMLGITFLYSLVGFYKLGSTKMAVTNWFPHKGDTVILQADEPVDEMWFFQGLDLPEGSYDTEKGVDIKIEVSKDMRRWANGTTMVDDAVFRWGECSWDSPKEYIKIKVRDTTIISEIALRVKDENRTVGYKVIEGGEGSENLNDEQDVIPDEVTYYTTGIFDEVYHPRTAYEHVKGWSPYETTHPPLGKWFITVGIWLFGMNFFGYRFMGTLFGVLMLPVLYHFSKKLFSQTWLSVLSTSLFSLDFLHLVQTRLATIDTYGVLFTLIMFDFMLTFVQMDFRESRLSDLMMPLLWSGLFFGIGAASKWTVIYGGLGLAVLYFVKLGTQLYRVRKMPEFEGKLSKVQKQEWKRKFKSERMFVWKRCLLLCCWCLLVFLVIPFVVYFISYLPYLLTNDNDPSFAGMWKNFWAYNSHMLSFHGGLHDDHVYNARWYEWPLMLRTMLYSTEGVQDGLRSVITAMGNPLVWWVGFGCLVFLIVRWFKERNLTMGVIIVGYLSVYCPWMFIQRSTFIYHYFQCVPFLALSIAAVFYWLDERYGKTVSIRGHEIGIVRVGSFVFVGLCLILFIVFLPVLVGILVSQGYIDCLKWLPRWAL